MSKNLVNETNVKENQIVENNNPRPKKTDITSTDTKGSKSKDNKDIKNTLPIATENPRPVGRPKKNTEDAVKRPVGRPKKETASITENTAKRPVGRPKKNTENIENIIKRPVGRPKKDTLLQNQLKKEFSNKKKVYIGPLDINENLINLLNYMVKFNSNNKLDLQITIK